VFNNPQIEFKSELFIVTNIIAWTYLLHAHYRKKKVEYRRRRPGSTRFQRTKHGAVYHWSLEESLDSADCPLDNIVKKNLRFLIGIRHEIEHQMTRRIDDQLSAKFQASALNFNDAIKKLFGKRYALDSEQAFSIQFAGISEDTAKELMAQADLPQHIQTYIVQYENGLTQAEYDDPRFSYRVAFVRKTSNAKTAADKVVEFVAAGSDTGVAINKVFLKETEKVKYRPSTIVKQIRPKAIPSSTCRTTLTSGTRRTPRTRNTNTARRLRELGTGTSRGYRRSANTVRHTAQSTNRRNQRADYSPTAPASWQGSERLRGAVRT
jgi:hypothetical protein